MTQPTTPAHHGGEEWRDLDQVEAAYDPQRSADTLRAARENIVRHRQDDLTLRLVDRAGRPLAGTPVEIAQTAHAFPFGDQVWELDAMIRDGEEATGRAQAWKRRFAEVLNAATNLCYWTERPRHDASKTEDRQGEPRVENFARTVAWCAEAGILAKGHPLFWSIPKCIPDWAQRYDTATLMKFAEVRVRSLVARFRGQVRLWDAVNEAIWEPAPKNLARRAWPHLESLEDMAEYVAEVLRWCREEDPEARFLINDYGMETEWDRPIPRGSNGEIVTGASQRRRYLDLARALQERGCPPDAIGLQSHTGWLRDHAEQWAVYDEFAALGLPVHITEFWAHTRELADSGRYSKETLEALQAEYVANFLTCAFGHPAVEAFFFWGFMGMALEWKERSGHETRPVFHRVRDLIHREWRTSLTVVTDRDGRAPFRGFHGAYSARLPLCGGALRQGLPFHLARGTAPELTLTVTHPVARP